MRLEGSPASVWGSTAEERRMRFPCDRYLCGIDGEYFRATDVRTPAAVLFRWLCQLKVAPYSYDLIDNFGRRSPKELTPGVENLARGQKPMSFFEQSSSNLRATSSCRSRKIFAASSPRCAYATRGVRLGRGCVGSCPGATS